MPRESVPAAGAVPGVDCETISTRVLCSPELGVAFFPDGASRPATVKSASDATRLPAGGAGPSLAPCSSDGTAIAVASPGFCSGLPGEGPVAVSNAARSGEAAPGFPLSEFGFGPAGSAPTGSLAGGASGTTNCATTVAAASIAAPAIAIGSAGDGDAEAPAAWSCIGAPVASGAFADASGGAAFSFRGFAGERAGARFADESRVLRANSWPINVSNGSYGVRGFELERGDALSRVRGASGAGRMKSSLGISRAVWVWRSGAEATRGSCVR